MNKIKEIGNNHIDVDMNELKQLSFFIWGGLGWGGEGGDSNRSVDFFFFN